MDYIVGMSNATVQRIFCGWIYFLVTLFNDHRDIHWDIHYTFIHKLPLGYTLKNCLKYLLKIAVV